MIERYLDWLETRSLGVLLAGIFIPCILIILVPTGIILGVGSLFGWFTTDITTHLNGHCEQFFQYVQVGKTLIVESVNVCP